MHSASPFGMRGLRARSTIRGVLLCMRPSMRTTCRFTRPSAELRGAPPGPFLIPAWVTAPAFLVITAYCYHNVHLSGECHGCMMQMSRAATSLLALILLDAAKGS